MGEMSVPADALYGAQTARAVENFPVSGRRMPREFLAAIGLVKFACAAANRAAGRLSPAEADAVMAAAQEVVDGVHDEQFPVDVFQTGSATSTNMNANEVIAARAAALMAAGGCAGGDGAGSGAGGGSAGLGKKLHPNDHVNMGQSSNDVIPTAMNVSAAVAIHGRLLPAVESLRAALADKAVEFDSVVKIGRTHLMDAVPVRLGQEFSGYAAQLAYAAELLRRAVADLCELPLGGTAVGTGLNAPAGFAAAACAEIARRTGLPFREAANHFAEQAARDRVLSASAAVRNLAVAMGKIASDIRLLASGPRCGLGELVLPATQPGSSIMPGKVNPVICESVIQVACQVVGHDAAITAGCTGGVGGLLELNVAMPMIADNLLSAIGLLTAVAGVFERKAIRGLQANVERCEQLVEQSLAMVTVLAPRIGYDDAADLAKQAAQSGKTIRELLHEKNLLPPSDIENLLDVRTQTGR
ncbi:MAG: class II fumarate hydratase [Phycisphaerae bacterium]|nr:class II fumarate hydratase [Phycisphaerae bacterium]